MTLADHVRTLGRGPGRARSLTQCEAQDAMRLMLSGTAAPEAVGALLMLLRMKGETPEEIAGFVEAAASVAPAMPSADLDWPSYASGRSRGAPWFLASACLVAQAGHRVVLHGWNGTDPKVRAGLAELGIGIAQTPGHAAELLERDRIVYLPLERHFPAVFDLLSLRDVLGLRSCLNTVCRMLNPARAKASVQGVFHPSYRELQADAAARLGWQSLSVIKGGGGEFEKNPAKDVAVFGLREGAPWKQSHAGRMTIHRRMAETTSPALNALWTGCDASPFETALVVETAALALNTLGQDGADALASKLWAQRTPIQAGQTIVQRELLS